eukprot:TRINITY_DN1454_c0_g1_i5.p1 TRINITY_DN1454_c0_g1~~TRINITY_DN1454_c0_g1_i5.p1  ORF type:complete len:186 (+),score=17.77 TRINITY_DN1454_c0_g1_i5:987-1544(+)
MTLLKYKPFASVACNCVAFEPSPLQQPMDTAACGNLMDQYLGTLAWYEPVLPSQAYHPFLSHIRFLQDLVRQHNYKSYLEIGCQHVARFSTMSAMVGSENSVWIDSGAGPHQGLDGSTFKQQHAGIKFDLVFVEGSHGAEHALSSIRLALSLLTPGKLCFCSNVLVVHNTGMHQSVDLPYCASYR